VSVGEVLATVDWLTVTATSDETRDRVRRKVKTATEIAAAAALTIRSWHWHGYAGWSIESFRYGERDDSSIVMLSGNACAHYWRDFAGEGTNITRVDLAVTTELDRPDDLLLMGYWDSLEDKKARGKPPRFIYTMMYNSQGGQTLYLGSRESGRFGRIYDKGIESESTDTPGKLWRYEVELKPPYSLPITRQLAGRIATDEVAPAIAGYVYEFFSQRYLTPRFPAEKNVILVEVELKAESDEATLKWLSTQVRSSVKRLAARDKLDDVLQALELDGLVYKRSYILSRGAENGAANGKGSDDRDRPADIGVRVGSAVLARD
jgi:DNA relaxase NicK